MDLEIKKAVIAPCPSQGGLQAKVWSRRRPLSASLILGACPLGNLLLFIMILRPLAYIRCPPYPHEASFLASLGPVKFCTHQISNPEYEQSPLRDEGPNFKNLFEDFWLCLYGVTGTNVALPPKSTRKMNSCFCLLDNRQQGTVVPERVITNKKVTNMIALTCHPEILPEFQQSGKGSILEPWRNRSSWNSSGRTWRGESYAEWSRIFSFHWQSDFTCFLGLPLISFLKSFKDLK